MDKVNFSFKDAFRVIAIVLIFGIDGLFNLFYFIISIVFAFNKFATPFNFIKTIQSSNYVIFGNVFISNVIYFVAGFIPGIIIGLAIKDVELPWWIDLFIKVALYYTTLQLFSCIWFWILILTICIIILIFKIIEYRKNLKIRNSITIKEDN